MRGLDEMTKYEEKEVKEVEKPAVDLNALMTKVLEIYDHLISPDDAYELLEDIAIISGTKERLHLYKPTKEEVIEEKEEKEEIIEEKDESEEDE